MRHLPRLVHGLRSFLARSALGLASRRAGRRPRAAIRWLRIAARLTPQFGEHYRELVDRLQSAGDRMGALAAARAAADRFPETPGAWMLLGEAYRAVYRTRDAVVAYEHALAVDEFPDAAMAAGELYRLMGDHVTAGARFARAYAAGAGPDALKENARSLRAAGDPKAADEAVAMWEKETGKTWESGLGP